MRPARLVDVTHNSHMSDMKLVDRMKALGRSEVRRLGLLTLGCVLMMLSPLVGILPGPGGVVVFAFGLGLALRNSAWAKRRYVEFKRRYPKPGSWADWGMRRESAKRRNKAAERKRDTGN
jgi:hypothetical protein